MEFSTENRKVYLLHQKNQDSSEDLHKVNKEVKGMSDEVFVASSPLLNDHLGVPHDESAEKQESSPQVDLGLKRKSSFKIFPINNSKILLGKSVGIGKRGSKTRARTE